MIFNKTVSFDYSFISFEKKCVCNYSSLVFFPPLYSASIFERTNKKKKRNECCDFFSSLFVSHIICVFETEAFYLTMSDEKSKKALKLKTLDEIQNDTVYEINLFPRKKRTQINEDEIIDEQVR